VYEEGYRSIRREDYDTLDSIIIDSVTVNGQAVDFYKQLNGDNAEIVWKRTYHGDNIIELNYTLRQRVELWDDYARICYEHFGANWPVQAGLLEARMTLPEASRGKNMHYQIYSAKLGNTYIDDLTIVTTLDNVPSGNYVGGCYLFARESINATGNDLLVVPQSAMAILKEERRSPDSIEFIAPEKPAPLDLYLAIIFIPLAVLCLLFLKNRDGLKYPENLLPPSNSSPVAVTALVRNELPEKDLLAATILDLVKRGNIDMVELEKPGEEAARIKRERTILLLRKEEGLKPHERAVVELIFDNDKKEVDLDQYAKDLKNLRSARAARATNIEKKLKKFRDEIQLVPMGKGLHTACEDRSLRTALAAIVGSFLFFLFISFLSPQVYFLKYHLSMGNSLNAIAFSLGLVADLGAVAYVLFRFMAPQPPKGSEDDYERWKAFERAVRSSRIKEYPPSSVVIWENILVYATALGAADRVKDHLSELDTILADRISRFDDLRLSSYSFASSAIYASSVSKYGDWGGSGGRSGGSSFGGFSSFSSGGWSMGGGGGFSGGGFSGGGGFR